MFKMYGVETSLDLVKDLNPPKDVVGGTWRVIICDFLWFYTSKPEDKISNSIAANAAYLAMTKKTYFEIWVSLDKSNHHYGQVIGRLLLKEDAEKRIAELESKRDYGKIEGIQVDWKDNWRDEERKMKEEKERFEQNTEVIPLDKSVSLVLNSDKKLTLQDIKCIKYKVRQYIADAKWPGDKKKLEENKNGKQQ